MSINNSSRESVSAVHTGVVGDLHNALEALRKDMTLYGSGVAIVSLEESTKGKDHTRLDLRLTEDVYVSIDIRTVRLTKGVG